MIRKAILIGSNTATSSALHGVDADVQRLYQHLTSDFGGAWEQEEIGHLKAPTARQLQSHLDVVSNEAPDILIIAFSGHGFTDEQGRSLICLRDNENFLVSKLQVAVDRQITIVDACRVAVRGTLAEGTVKKAGVGDVSGIDGWDYRASCRAQFDTRLRAVATGRMLLQSCSLGEYSSDYQAGGLFTHSLIKLARVAALNSSDWKRSNKHASVSTSFKGAKTETQRVNPNQRPTATVRGQGADLPFVVA